MFTINYRKLVFFIYYLTVLDIMSRFIGRENELAALDQFYNTSTFKCCSIMGRRRIGKTELIKKFVEDKDFFYIEFLNSTLENNLRLISRKMKEYTGIEREYKDTMEFLWDLAKAIEGRKTVVAFDEFPYILEKDDSFAALTQYFIDEQIGESKLIISGSSVKTMKHETMDKSRPLYGRTWKMEVEGMSIADTVKFHPNISDLDQLKVYMIAGGCPLYHDVPEFSSFEEYVQRFILTENSQFSHEGESIIERELSPKDRYIDILDSMRGRRSDINTISARTKIDRDTCTQCVKSMIDLGFIENVMPMFGAEKKPKYYTISDPMVSFYYQVLRMDTTFSDDPDDRFKALRPTLSTVRGLIFEDYCRSLLSRFYPVKEIGSWWGSGPKRDQWGNIKLDEDGNPIIMEHDIDVALVTISGYNQVKMAVECKFSSEPQGFGALNELNAALECIKGHEGIRRMIISVSGFDKDFEEYATDNGIILIGLNMLLGKEPLPKI